MQDVPEYDQPNDLEIKAKHTPTPWKMEESQNKYSTAFDILHVKSGAWIAVVHGGREFYEADAKFIITAVNNFESLTEALAEAIALEEIAQRNGKEVKPYFIRWKQTLADAGIKS